MAPSRLRRKEFINGLAAIPLVSAAASSIAQAVPATTPRSRARPGSPRWPDAKQWQHLNDEVGGRLQRLTQPFAHCATNDCDALFRNLKNPFYINEHPNVTQTLGWADAWKTEASACAVAAQSAADVAAAVRFASDHDLRLVVRGGAHSYQGTPNAPDSLLIWTRGMSDIVMHGAFVPTGCTTDPVPAVSIGSGAIWLHAYTAVTTQHGRYVQGGGCATVGVAGLVSGGGFGSFSKRYGTGAAGLLEAEIVTADGTIRTINACRDPELFWAVKGGGGGTFGAITRLTLRTHELPTYFGAVLGTIKANSDPAFQRLTERFVAFYARMLHNERWGEQVAFSASNTLTLLMLSSGLSQGEMEAAWAPFLSFVAGSPADYTWSEPQRIFAVPARSFWDPDFIKAHYPSIVTPDARASAKPGDFWWTGNTHEAAQFIHEYRSLWMPDALLAPERQAMLADGLFAASRHWRTSLHFNKGLGGGSQAALDASGETATNPLVLDAFALAIVASEGDNVYPGVAGHEPNLTEARSNATAVRAAMSELSQIVSNVGAYVSEASYFDESWQDLYWGSNYPRLVEVKKRYDPEDLFIVHHGVGSERWTSDGFTRLS